MTTNLFSQNSNFYNLIHKLNKRPYKLFYRMIPKPIRKYLDKQADYSQQKYIAHCWNQLIDQYLLDPKNNFQQLASNRTEQNRTEQTIQSDLQSKIIWQYWGQGCNSENLPDSVKLCYLSVEKYKGDCKVIRLDDNNIHQYLDIPDFVLNKKGKGDFNFTFYSDLIRLMLLQKYGGVWVDSTILFTAPLPAKFFNQPYFVYQRSPHTENKAFWYKFNKNYFSWNNKQQVKMLNSIMFAQKNNPLINCLLDLMLVFWRHQTEIPHYFFFQILYNCVINNPKFNFTPCEIIDDTIPHLLQTKLYQPFNLERFKQITKIITIHKLTYAKEYEQNSFYDYLKQQYQL